MKFTDSEIQSTGAFLVGQLERLDPHNYDPIAEFTWSRDMPLREDVTIADEVTSFILTNYAGGFGGTGSGTKSWIRGEATTPARVSIQMNKITTPVTPWGMEVDYTIFDLEKAMKAGR
uniref:major capsid family protein n=1 Tax=Mesosutterella multiformis TaxID=2259133 RepID=UPI00402A1BAB